MVTDFARKYKSDVFLQTEVNIISLQVAYAIIILLISVGGVILTTEASAEKFILIALIILGMTTLLGYLVARRALAPARTALASQKEFIGNVAHELRTPLAIIKANTEVLLMEKRGDRYTQESLASNVEELNRINDIINNLLTLNVLVQPEQVVFDHVDFGTIIRRIVAKIARPTRERPVRIRVRVGSDCLVWGNAAALEQIATNILKNAIEHTSHGEIAVTAECTVEGHFEFSVRDTGTGISERDLFRIFEPFYRGDRARTRSENIGSGLGLTIVSELVKLHKGRVSIKSAPGQGTTVSVMLPRGSKRSDQLEGTSPMSEVFADFWNGKRSK